MKENTVENIVYSRLYPVFELVAGSVPGQVDDFEHDGAREVRVGLLDVRKQVRQDLQHDLTINFLYTSKCSG